MKRLDSKVCVITGAARGIGRAIGQAMIAEGAIVVLSDLADEAGERAASAMGTAAEFHHLDVREEKQWIEVLDRIVARHGRVDVVVNNAGITGFEDGLVAHDPENTSLEDWHAVHATNLDGVFLGCKHAIRVMRSGTKGSIVNISSRSGLVGIPQAAAYASSKAAVRNHTKSVALYCAQQGLNIRCNSIHPAAILTPMWEAMLGTGPERETRIAMIVKDTPLKRFGTPDEVASMAVYLASAESGYTTGAEFVLDGGILAGTTASPGS